MLEKCCTPPNGTPLSLNQGENVKDELPKFSTLDIVVHRDSEPFALGFTPTTNYDYQTNKLQEQQSSIAD